MSKVASSLKKAAVKMLAANTNDYSEVKNHSMVSKIERNPKGKDIIDSIKQENYEEPSSKIRNDNKHVSVNDGITSTSGSSRRRKGKPSKKIVSTCVLSPLSTHSNENEPELELDKNEIEDGEEEEVPKQSINPTDFLETKLRCHGAFFSSYNPRLINFNI